MSTKLLSIILLLTLANTYGQIGWVPWEEELEVPTVGDDLPCDQTICVEPCPGAAPPNYCPQNITKCASGCVCMLECRSPTHVCFQTKFCISRRRYLNKKPTPAFV